MADIMQRRRRVGQTLARRSKKKKQCMAAGDLENIPDEILMEILVRLPVKSVLRLKRVSKRWLSLITSPVFVNFFRYHSLVQRPHSVFFIMPSYTYGHWSGDLLIVDPNKANPRDRATVHTPSVPSYKNARYRVATNTLNGLICLYHHYESLIAMYNLTTLENLSLPRITTTVCSSTRRKCYLGFDPTKQKYKVLHVFSSLDGTVECQVLTVGTKGKDINTWRTINTSNIHNNSSILNFCSDELGFYHHGAIYWTYENMWRLEITDDDSPCGIFAFNVERETLEFIPYSQEILVSEGEISVCQIGGQVSLVEVPSYPYSSISDIALWKLIDRKDREDNNINPLWSRRQVISFPFTNIQAGGWGWGRFLMCTDFGLLCLVRDAAMSSSSDGDDITVDLYDIATGRSTVLNYSAKPNQYEEYKPFSVLRVPNQYEFRPSVIIHNITPLKDI